MSDKPSTVSFSRRLGTAVVTGLTVAVTAYLASVLAFFVAGQGTTSTLAGLHGFFVWTTLFAFLFSVVLVLVGGLSHWNTARKIALVRPPATTLANGELTHLERVPVDLDLANASGMPTSPPSRTTAG